MTTPLTALIAAAERLDRRGLAAATSGNHSLRLADGTIAISRSGLHKGRLAPADFMTLAANGTPIDEGTPSAEAALHVMLYRERGAGAVLHWHSSTAVGWSRAFRGRDRAIFTAHEMLKAFPGITTHATARALPIVDNSQDMAEIIAAVAPPLAAPDALPAFLIRDHGVYAWGGDVDEAERIAEAIEWLFAAELAETQFRTGDRR